MNKAVFTTSDIQRFKGTSDELESTGKLEKAISQGYEVFVITTRTRFKPEIDSWWQNQVSNVYTGYTGNGATDSGMIETYKRFYRDQHIDIDQIVIGKRGCDTKEMSEYHEKFPLEDRWTSYENELRYFGFKTGKDF